ncbi:uncharacterized protein LOC134565092 [Prinia subflava]|uniref:uncharacterized protein LOC134565092 n=1 Tax=Prinia subflava TaxID=208062 RepID=UPI002FE27DBD
MFSEKKLLLELFQSLLMSRDADLTRIHVRELYAWGETHGIFYTAGNALYIGPWRTLGKSLFSSILDGDLKAGTLLKAWAKVFLLLKEAGEDFEADSGLSEETRTGSPASSVASDDECSDAGLEPMQETPTPMLGVGHAQRGFWKGCQVFFRSPSRAIERGGSQGRRGGALGIGPHTEHGGLLPAAAVPPLRPAPPRPAPSRATRAPVEEPCRGGPRAASAPPRCRRGGGLCAAAAAGAAPPPATAVRPASLRPAPRVRCQSGAAGRGLGTMPPAASAGSAAPPPVAATAPPPTAAARPLPARSVESGLSAAVAPPQSPPPICSGPGSVPPSAWALGAEAPLPLGTEVETEGPPAPVPLVAVPAGSDPVRAIPPRPALRGLSRSSPAGAGPHRPVPAPHRLSRAGSAPPPAAAPAQPALHGAACAAAPPPAPCSPPAPQPGTAMRSPRTEGAGLTTEPAKGGLPARPSPACPVPTPHRRLRVEGAGLPLPPPARAVSAAAAPLPGAAARPPRSEGGRLSAGAAELPPACVAPPTDPSAKLAGAKSCGRSATPPCPTPPRSERRRSESLSPAHPPNRVKPAVGDEKEAEALSDMHTRPAMDCNVGSGPASQPNQAAELTELLPEDAAVPELVQRAVDVVPQPHSHGAPSWAVPFPFRRDVAKNNTSFTEAIQWISAEFENLIFPYEIRGLAVVMFEPKQVSTFEAS